jgi:glycosyltransferase involved in cell wall biosynthesis
MQRIAGHLRASGHEVLYRWTTEPCPTLDDLRPYGTVDVVFGNHALLTGRLCQLASLPYVIVLGGTDLNEDARDPAFAHEMHHAARGALRIVAYNRDFEQRAQHLWPDCAGKVIRIPKGVDAQIVEHAARLPRDIGSDVRVFLLPAGLRRVKDVLYLADVFDTWHEEDPKLRLVIVGVPREPDYAQEVYLRCAQSPAVRVLDPVPRTALFALMRHAEATLNTSRSECSPNALLEAMDLGCPVIARNVPGVREIVIDGLTGLLFNSTHGFIEQAKRLCNPVFRERLTREGRSFVRAEHSLAAERKRYRELAASLCL